MAILARSVANSSPYAVGNKIYGGGRSMPTLGPVDKMGYRERDAVASSRRDAIERRMKANAKGNYASADALRKV